MRVRVRQAVACSAVGLLAMAVAACASAPTTAATSRMSQEQARDLLAVLGEAENAYAAGEYATAVEHYTQLARATPVEPTYWYRLANSLVQEERYDEASLAYERALRLSPDDAKAWHNLGVVRLLQSQQALAEAVKRSGKGDEVFSGSLALSAGVFSLVERHMGSGAAKGGLPAVETQPETREP